MVIEQFDVYVIFVVTKEINVFFVLLKNFGSSRFRGVIGIFWFFVSQLA